MDPLSATLAVVSLAAAVRDIVELGKKIHQSFAKVSKRHIVAQGLAEEIREMLDDLEEFCEQNREVLESSPDFHAELQDLLIKLKGFEDKILPCLRSQETSRRSLLIRGWDTWRKSEAIETSTRELKDDVKKLVRRYMIKGVIRMRANTERTYHTTTQSLKVLEDMRKEMSDWRTSTTVASRLALTSPILPMISPVTLAQCTDQIIVEFANTSLATSPSNLRPPSQINDEIMSTAYVKFQINTLMTLLEAASQSLATPNAPKCYAMHHRESPLLLILPEHSMPVAHLRRKAVRKVTYICDLLEMTAATMSMSEAVMALSQLSFYLGGLEMDDDAVLISGWVVKLSRNLLGQTNVLEARTDIARHLLNYSIDLQRTGDHSASLTAIEEAYSITHRQVQDAHNVPKQILLLHCLVLEQYALTLQDRHLNGRRCLELAEESVRIIESVLTASTGLNVSDMVGRFDLRLPGQQYAVASSKVLVVKYAQARTVLSKVLAVNGQFDEALVSMRFGLALYREISSYDAEIIPQLASALYNTITGSISDMLTGDERLHYVCECIDLYRDLARRNPKHYTRLLIPALWVKAEFLRATERHEESLEVWTEVVDMAGQTTPYDRVYAPALDNLSQQFRILDRYDDAIRIRTLAISAFQGGAVEVQADRYFLLYGDLQLAGRFDEATEAIRTSLALYRMLAVQDSNKWVDDVGVGLSALAECLVLVGDYDNAASAGHESMHIFSNYLKTSGPQQWPPGGLLNALRTMRDISFLLDDGTKSMTIISEVMKHYSRLVEAFPLVEHVTEDLLYCQHCYGVILYQLGHLIEAQKYFERLLQTWEQTPPSWVSNEYMIDRRLIALGAYAKILYATGEANQRINVVLHQVVNTSSQGRDSEAFGRNLYWIRLKVLFTAELGQTHEALRVAEETLRLARLAVDVHDEDLIDCLHAVADAAIFCQSYQRLVEIAEEALEKCQKDGTPTPLFELPESPLCERAAQLPRSLRLLSFGIANLGRVQDGLNYAKEAVFRGQELRTLKSLASSVATQSYIETRGNLGSMLVANGSFSEALEIFEERRRYFSERVEARNGEYRELVPTLYILGTLCCNDERHDDGRAAVEELRRIMSCLKAAHPGLHEQIKLRLQHELMTPIFQGLNNIRDNLQCSHMVHGSELLLV